MRKKVLLAVAVVGCGAMMTGMSACKKKSDDPKTYTCTCDGKNEQKGLSEAQKDSYTTTCESPSSGSLLKNAGKAECK